MMPNNIGDIVVVDDNVVLLATLSEILKTRGYSVRTASDGICALSAIRYQAPDVLLCDLNMPGISGFELLSIVRRCYSENQSGRDERFVLRPCCSRRCRSRRILGKGHDQRS